MSRLKMACTDSRPTPGQAKMVSVITDPPSKVPSSMPTMVTMGIEALRRACFHTTGGSLTPLARAVRM
jgi:hypothetical protein